MSKRIALLISGIFLLNFISSAQSYQGAESIEYDEANNRFLISNGNNILARASDGTLSFFGTGSASHGMEVMEDKLYALDSPNLKAFDLETEEEVMSLNISGAVFLNGLTNDGVNTLYATDFSAGKIYKIDVSDIDNPSFEIIVENTDNETPNGIIYDGANNRLIYTNWGGNAKIQAVDLTDFSISDVVQTSVGNIDGIDDDSDGNFYISSWSPSGRITKYDANFENPVTVTTPTLNGPADIGYAQAIDTLGVPQGNDADYIGFEVVSNTADLVDNDFQLLVYPNPVTDASWIQFELEKATELSVRVIDMTGRVHYASDVLEGEGVHKIPVGMLELGSGSYRVILETGGQLVNYGFNKSH
ncbi:MAG: T9SS type A sorting domain-containing protein [Saprospiraceae bacterium]